MNLGVIARIAASAILIVSVAIPFADIAKTHFTKTVSDFVPETHIEARCDPDTAGKTQEQNPPKDTSDKGTSGDRRVIKESRADTRVWAYAIQTIGLLAVLGITLWAVVALIRID